MKTVFMEILDKLKHKGVLIMYFENWQRTIISLLALIICSGCITFNSASEIEDIIDDDRTDYSFPVTGEILEANNVFSVIERAAPWRKKEPLPEANILLTGVVTKPFPFLSINRSWSRIIRLKYQADDTMWFLSGYLRSYRWSGTITIEGNSVDTDIQFDVCAYDKDGGGKKEFILTRASLGNIWLECDDPLEVYNSGIGDFPFLIGYAHLPDAKYRIYAVLDNSPNRIPTYYNQDGKLYRGYFKEVFFNPFQRFQFLDENATVIAELENNRFNIYDTMPEEKTRDIKRAAALLIGFRHSTMMMNSFGVWEPAFFHRYVYQ